MTLKQVLTCWCIDPVSVGVSWNVARVAHTLWNYLISILCVAALKSIGDALCILLNGKAMKSLCISLMVLQDIEQPQRYCIMYMYEASMQLL